MVWLLMLDALLINLQIILRHKPTRIRISTSEAISFWINIQTGQLKQLLFLSKNEYSFEEKLFFLSIINKIYFQFF